MWIGQAVGQGDQWLVIGKIGLSKHNYVHINPDKFQNFFFFFFLSFYVLGFGQHWDAIIESMLFQCSMMKDMVHVVLWDNAWNMAKAMEDCGLISLGRLSRTLQLPVSKGVVGRCTERSVFNRMAIGRRIAGHFKHSQHLNIPDCESRDWCYLIVCVILVEILPTISVNLLR